MPNGFATEAADLVEFIRQMPFVVKNEQVSLFMALTWPWMIGMKPQIIRKSGSAIPRKPKIIPGKCWYFGRYTSLWFCSSKTEVLLSFRLTDDGKIGMDGGAVYGEVSFMESSLQTQGMKARTPLSRMMALLPKIVTPSRVWMCQMLKIIYN